MDDIRPSRRDLLMRAAEAVGGVALSSGVTEAVINVFSTALTSRPASAQDPIPEAQPQVAPGQLINPHRIAPPGTMRQIVYIFTKQDGDKVSGDVFKIWANSTIEGDRDSRGMTPLQVHADAGRGPLVFEVVARQDGQAGAYLFRDPLQGNKFIRKSFDHAVKVTVTDDQGNPNPNAEATIVANTGRFMTPQEQRMLMPALIRTDMTTEIVEGLAESAVTGIGVRGGVAPSGRAGIGVGIQTAQPVKLGTTVVIPHKKER